MATLYITEQGATVSKTDERLVIRKGRRILQEIPAVHVEQIVVFGNANFTTPAMAFLLERGIDVAYLSSRGQYRGRLQPRLCKDASLRQLQYKRSLDPAFRLAVAKQIVSGKVHNALVFCQRQRRLAAEAQSHLETLIQIIHRIPTAIDIEAVRGYEGAASAAYYKIFKTLLKQDMGFRSRKNHPPTDPVNALLSLGYTLLYNNLYAFINIVGLDPYLGFFHETKHGHAALASDLLEEWRTILVDSVVLSLINRGELGPGDFRKGLWKIRLTKEGLEKFLRAYDRRLATEILHADLGQRLSYRRCLEAQVRRFVRVLYCQEKLYSPFKVR